MTGEKKAKLGRRVCDEVFALCCKMSDKEEEENSL